MINKTLKDNNVSFVTKVWYYTIIDLGICCYLDLSTWKNV